MLLITLFLLQSITLHDTAVVSFQDLGSQFFLREEDVGNMRNRWVHSQEILFDCVIYLYTDHTETIIPVCSR